MWLAIFCALSASASILCMLAATYAARIAIRRSASPRQAIRSVELRIQSLEDWRMELTQTLLDMANQLKMKKVRAATNHSAGSRDEPDPYQNPDAWRTMMNKRIAASKFNGGTP